MTIDTKKKTFYRVNDNCESPVIHETLEEAIQYLKDCLEGIDNGCPVSIEKVQMTQNQFNSLPEGM